MRGKSDSKKACTLILTLCALFFQHVGARADLEAIAVSTLYSPEGGSFWLFYLPIDGDSDHRFGYQGGTEFTDYWVKLEKAIRVDNGNVVTASNGSGFIIGSNAMGGYVYTSPLQGSWHSDVGIYGATAYTWCMVNLYDGGHPSDIKWHESSMNVYMADVP